MEELRPVTTPAPGESVTPIPTESVNDGIVTIQFAQEAIENDDPDRLTLLLSKMPLERLSNFEALTLLNRFLSTCAEYGRTSCVQPLINAWSVVQPDIVELSLVPALFLEPLFNTPTLRFVVMALEDVTYLEVMEELIGHDAGPMMALACQQAIDVFGEQPRFDYEMLRDEAEARNNDKVYNFIMSKLDETADYAPIPPWIKNFLAPAPIPRASELKIPEYHPPKFDIPDLDTCVDLLIEGLQAQSVEFEKTKEIDNAKQILRARLAIANEVERAALLMPLLQKSDLESLQSNHELFRILGPANPLYDADLDQMEYGGCRMFTCDIFDYDEETDYTFDWFLGVCDKCHLKIRVRWHAVRMPRPAGGWLGCYCSWQCVRDAIDDKELAEVTPDLATRVMVDSLEDQFEDIKIQDRLPD